VAALALVGVGLGAGWTGHAWQQRGGDAELPPIAHRVSAGALAAAADKIVVHFSSSAPDRVSEMLDDVEGLLRAARDSNRPIAVEILANNTGLDLLRADVAGPSERLASLRAENPNLTLVACRQTIERLRERGVVVQLLPETAVATSALDEVVTRIHEGWTYIRT
jgi:intracellular sulfur oxidation DsrE/DsrF family protein